MEKIPQFIKDFSKENVQSQEDRIKIAREIKDIRNKERERLTDEKVEKKEKDLQYEIELNKIEDLNKEIEEISSTLPNKLLNYFKYRKTLAKIKGQKQVVLDFEREEDTMSFDEGKFAKSSIEKSVDMDPELILKKFYISQEKKWANSPYTKKDIEKNFTTEHLASLSLDEYILLMKRFPSQMVTHVTRQGIRDHLGGVNHNKDFGKYWNGFGEIIKSGVQKSNFEIFIAEQEKRDAIKKYLNLDQGCSKEDIQKRLLEFTRVDSQNSHGSFSDMSSIHFATEEVADAHYGAEKGNEIFFAYPSIFIASQYYFSGQLARADGGTHNNQWVWTEDESSGDKGLDINAGFVFIPANAKVDIKNGSRYELDKGIMPSLNIELENRLMDLIKIPGFKNFISDVYQELGHTNINIERLWKNEGLYGNRETELQTKIKGWAEELKKLFNIADREVQKLILTYDFSSFAVNSLNIDNIKTINDSLRSVLINEGLGFTLAKETISSKEYWENYFQKNPSKRPSKIVYYEGVDPTKALQNWKIENGLNIKDDSRDMGFSEHDLDLTKSPDVIAGKASRFYNLAMDVVEEYFMEN